jgi:hypothetical protein
MIFLTLKLDWSDKSLLSNGVVNLTSSKPWSESLRSSLIYGRLIFLFIFNLIETILLNEVNSLSSYTVGVNAKFNSLA